MLTQQNDGKEINLNLEDALISMEALRIMMGGAIEKASATDTVKVRRSEQAKVTTAGTLPKILDHLTKQELTLPANYRYIDLTSGDRGRVGEYTENGETKTAPAPTWEKDHVIRFVWEDVKKGVNGNPDAVEITISPNTFPGTYRIVGDTFWRNENGKDKPFQFIIYKAETSVA